MSELGNTAVLSPQEIRIVGEINGEQPAHGRSRTNIILLTTINESGKIIKNKQSNLLMVIRRRKVKMFFCGKVS